MENQRQEKVLATYHYEDWEAVRDFFEQQTKESLAFAIANDETRAMEQQLSNLPNNDWPKEDAQRYCAAIYNRHLSYSHDKLISVCMRNARKNHRLHDRDSIEINFPLASDLVPDLPAHRMKP